MSLPEQKIEESIFERCYSPYSKIKICARLTIRSPPQDQSYEYVYGVNVENASYGLTICAERSCIVSAISEGAPLNQAEEMTIQSTTLERVTPCGACLQFISEVFPPNFPIICIGTKEEKRYKLRDLLPHGFNIPESKGS